MAAGGCRSRGRERLVLESELRRMWQHGVIEVELALSRRETPSNVPVVRFGELSKVVSQSKLAPVVPPRQPASGDADLQRTDRGGPKLVVCAAGMSSDPAVVAKHCGETVLFALVGADQVSRCPLWTCCASSLGAPRLAH